VPESEERAGVGLVLTGSRRGSHHEAGFLRSLGLGIIPFCPGLVRWDTADWVEVGVAIGYCTHNLEGGTTLGWVRYIFVFPSSKSYFTLPMFGTATVHSYAQTTPYYLHLHANTSEQNVRNKQGRNACTASEGGSRVNSTDNTEEEKRYKEDTSGD